VETERGYSEGKDTGEVNKKGNISKKKGSKLQKQKEASNKGNTHSL